MADTTHYVGLHIERECRFELLPGGDGQAARLWIGGSEGNVTVYFMHPDAIMRLCNEFEQFVFERCQARDADYGIAPSDATKLIEGS